MSIKLVFARILEEELRQRGIGPITAADCEVIVARLVEQVRDLELKLAIRELSAKLPQV